MMEMSQKKVVIHAAWSGEHGYDALFIYAEEMRRYNNQKTVTKFPFQTYSDHPFVIPEAELKKNVHIILGRLATEGYETPFLFPTSGGLPLPSPELIPEYRDKEFREAGLSLWIIPGLLTTPGRAMKALIKMDLSNQEVQPGRSLLFWRSLSLFGLKLISMGYLVPGLSGWQVKIQGPFVQEYESLLLNAPKNLLASSTIWKRGDLDAVFRRFLNAGATELAATHFSETDSYTSTLFSDQKGRKATTGEWIRHLGKSRIQELRKNKIPKQIKDWFSDPAGDSSSTIIMNLNEPQDGDEWSVSFSVKTPKGLFLPEELEESLPELYHLFGDLKSRMETQLASAARIFPPILREEGKLTEEEVLDLLTKKGDKLLASGVTLELPAWCRRGVTAPQLNMRTSDGSGVINLSDLLDFDWTVSLGDEITLTPDEFQKLVDQKRPLIRLRDRWILLSPEDLTIAAKTIPKKGRLTLAEAMQFAMGESPEGWKETAITFPRELEERVYRLFRKEAISPLDEPEGFSGELRHYQKIGAAWLQMLDESGMGGCLADDMGLGKTIQVIAYLLERGARLGPIGYSPILIVTPMSVLGTWKREFRRFAPDLRCDIHHGTERRREDAFEAFVKENEIILTSYALLVRDFEMISRIHWKVVILDEAQNIKNPASKQSRAARKIHAEIRFALTGTPIENRLSELWSIMEFLNPGYLGSHERFQKRFAVPIEKGRSETKAEILKRIISPFLLRRMKTDEGIAADLPEKMETKVYCRITTEQAAAYQAVVDTLIQDLNTLRGFAKRGRILATLTKLKQVCNHPDLLHPRPELTEGRSGKIERLYEILQEILDNGEKALIFTQYASFGQLIREDLTRVFQCPVLFLSGKTTRSKREEMIQQFQSVGGPPLFVLSLKAGGTGITLTHATHVIHLDRWWNPAVENQATDRTYRIGQKENVQIHLMISEGTIEEKIDLLLEEKKKLAEAVIGGGEDWIGELSDDDIKALIRLERN
jgi:Superfamily II DNA/RNA helicases, SNF2 family